MLFKDLKKEHSYRELANKIGLTHGDLCLQVNHRGFSASTVRKIIEAYPDIDAKDLFKNYPLNKRHLNRLQLSNLKKKEYKNVTEDTIDNRAGIVRSE